MKSLIKRFLRKAGLEIRKDPYRSERQTGLPDYCYDLDRERRFTYNVDAIETIRTVRNYTMLPYVNLMTLYEQVKFCELNEVLGDYVECGVWKGGACALMAMANKRYSNTRRTIHLFDIFDDICEPDPVKDGEAALAELEQLTGRKLDITGKLHPVSGVYSFFGGPGRIDEVRNLMENISGYDRERLKYHVGWFQETLPVKKHEIDRIAILRLDGDLYYSIKVCLEELYEKISPGGFVIIDDYGYYKGCTDAVDEFRAANGITSYMHYSNAFCRYWVK